MLRLFTHTPLPVEKERIKALTIQISVLRGLLNEQNQKWKKPEKNKTKTFQLQ